MLDGKRVQFNNESPGGNNCKNFENESVSLLSCMSGLAGQDLINCRNAYIAVYVTLDPNSYIYIGIVFPS